MRISDWSSDVCSSDLGFTNAGQSCSGVERLLVHDRIFDRFLADLVAQAHKLVVHADDGGEADIGRMTTGFQRDKVIEHVEEALAAGARLRFGRIPDRESLLVQPMIIDQVTPDMRLWRDETFGPVLPVMRFADEADAIRLANDRSEEHTSELQSLLRLSY